MNARVETMLFSAIAVLLAAMTVTGLSDLAFRDARAAANGRTLEATRYASCSASATAAAPAARRADDRRG